MKKEFQWKKLLDLLRQHPMSTVDIASKFIPAPQKVIQTLRGKGYDIKTEPIEGKKHRLYVLYEHEEQLRLFNA